MPDGIRVVKVGPPFDMVFWGIKCLRPIRRLTAHFNLREYFKRDETELHKALQSDLVRRACQVFDCSPIVEAKALAAAQLLTELDPHWAVHVARFPPALHASILYLADRVPCYRQLVHRCPGLAVDVLRNAVTVCGKQLASADDYLHVFLEGGIKDVAARLDWPTGTMGILKRLWVPAASFKGIDALKKRLSSNDPAGRRARRLLPHCKQITFDAIRVISDPVSFDRVQNSFLIDLCSSAPAGYDAGTGEWKLLSLLLKVGARSPHLRVPSICTTEQLKRLFQRYFAGLSWRTANAIIELKFPRPPFLPDDSCFQFVEGPFEALAEAVEMGPNCLAEMIPEVARGELYILRVLPDSKRRIERASLVICPRATTGGRSVWGFDDARTKHNGPIGESTARAINAFLCRVQAGVSEADLFHKLPT